ncbi:unnamed protein product [Medioppia subpectinata]|uniref:Uncharacterized protein n=1 Tax=Medioppia subpectinata TaxID=1979941 RepID=A0A7R9LKU6_9ACAR|nr:unnamed protein product [Medioppia subpectinata]CAG2119697.1 unnamed protein product [Medioppia subpectinata]
MAGHEIPTIIMISAANPEILDVNETNDHINQYEEDMDVDYTTPPAGGLTPVAKCCLKRQCFNKFAPQVQEDCFNRFWSIRNKTNQNYFLAGLMSADEPKRTVQNPVRHNKTVSWTYFVDVRGKKVQVCQNFVTAVYGISSSKIQTIQHKLLSGSSLDDLRGKFSKRKKPEEESQQRVEVITLNTTLHPNLHTAIHNKKVTKKKIK